MIRRAEEFMVRNSVKEQAAALWMLSVENRRGLQRILVNHNNTQPLPMFFVSVASKGLMLHVSGLESTLAGSCVSVDSKDT